MKRTLLFGLLLALAATLLCAPGLALADDTLGTGAVVTQDDDVKPWEAADFTWDDTTVTGLSDEGKAKLLINSDMVIPDTNPDGKAVTAIGNMAFRQVADITAVSMPKTITTMGDAAFNSCSKLEKITLSEGLTAIPAGAFLKNGNDDSAISDVVIPDGVKSIGNNAFAGAKVANLTLPKSLETVGNSAFLNHQLKEVVLPKGVTSLGTSAFSIARDDLPKTLAKIVLNDGLNAINGNAFRNAQVESVELPATVTVLNKTAFNGCDPVVTLLASKSIQLVESKSFIVKGAGHIVKGDLSKATVTAEDTMILDDPATPAPVVTFDDQTVDADAYDVAYENNTASGEATVTVTAKNDSAYTGSATGTFTVTDAKEWTAADFTWEDTTVTGLSDAGTAKLALNAALEIPATNADGKAVTAIGNMAFRGTAVASVTMPDTIITMGQAAFNTCENLTNVTLSASLKEIPQSAFLKNEKDSPALAEIVIPEGVETIGRFAFSGAKVSKLTLPSTLTTIDQEAFRNNQLAEIVLPENVTTVGKWAFSIPRRDLEKTVKKVVLNDKLASIADGAFADVDVAQVDLPASVTTLHKDAFSLSVDARETLIVLVTSSAVQLADTDTFASKGTGHVVKGDLSKAIVAVEDVLSTGEALTPAVSVTFDGQAVDAAAYDVAYANNIEVGTASVTVTAKADAAYIGSAAGTFRITTKALDEAEAIFAAVPDAVAASDAAAVQAAVSAFLNLTDAEKAAVNPETLAKLIAAQESVIALQNKASEEAQTAAKAQIEQLKADLAAAKKKTQTIKVKTASKSFKVAALNKAAKSFKIGAKTNGKGKLSYKVTKKNAKLTFKNGKVTVKKGTKAGSYKMKVKITAAAKGNYKKTTKTFVITVKVVK